MTISSVTPQATVLTPNIQKAQPQTLAVADNDRDSDDRGGAPDTDTKTSHLIDIKA